MDKSLKEKRRKKQKGITLIALVVTIIVLLILVAVSISTLTGENGLITRAKEAAEKTRIAKQEEALKLRLTELQMAIVSNPTEEEILDLIKDIVNTINAKGLYRVDVKMPSGESTEETLKINMKLDYVRGENNKNYREVINLNITEDKKFTLSVESSKEIKEIDPEALIPIILLESAIKGEESTEVETVGENIFKYKEEYYSMVMDINQEEMAISIYFQKEETGVPEDLTFKDIETFADSAIGITIEGKLYYWDMGDKNELPVDFAEIKELPDAKGKTFDKIISDLVLDTEGNYYRYLWNYTLEPIYLNENCKIKEYNGSYIISEDGKLWDIDGICYSDTFKELNSVTFEKLQNSRDIIAIDTQGNAWEISKESCICLNTMPNSTINGIKIKEIEEEYLLGENGKLYKYEDYEKEVIEINIDKKVLNIIYVGNVLVYQNESNEIWYTDYYSNNKLDTDGIDIEKMYPGGFILDKKGNIFKVNYEYLNNQDYVTIEQIYENTENAKFKDISSQEQVIILLDENNKIYQFGDFIKPQ